MKRLLFVIFCAILISSCATGSFVSTTPKAKNDTSTKTIQCYYSTEKPDRAYEVRADALCRVQDARHLSNPTRNERSECRVGYATGARSCVSETHYYHQRWTSSTATRIVACIQHACPRIAPATPHCAPLRSACMGLLRFRAAGTRRKSPDYPLFVEICHFTKHKPS